MNQKKSALPVSAESSANADPFGCRDTMPTHLGPAIVHRLARLDEQAICRIDALPYCLRVLLEAVLRNCDGYVVTEDDVRALATWQASAPAEREIPFQPARVVLQDFTGVPAIVDLAAMRSAMQRLHGQPARINPLIPVDLVIDHSIQVDYFGGGQSLEQNLQLEFERNRERYEFLRWGQQAFNNFRVVPPNVGIVHQVNLEYLASGVFLRPGPQGLVALPDSLVGTDSHTTMINGLGVLGWGVGGIEAEAVMLGQPLYMLLPEVIGFELTGQLAPGATATDLVLTVTEILRKQGVVGKFVEFIGAGVSKMPLADRATIANMAPEYGATVGFFPTDHETLNFLRRTGRAEADVQVVDRYTKIQQLFRTDDAPIPQYTKVLKLDLNTIEPSLAGPKRPQDRVALGRVKHGFREALQAPVQQRGFALDSAALARTAEIENGKTTTIRHGAVVIAAITSCTNTSNPSVMLAAGLLAKKAVQRGLKVPSYVKTSLAPGSRVVTDYLEKAGLNSPLDALGFYTVGYGCTTCIGNSGPLPEAVAKAVKAGQLVVSAVLSGNRNFEGRVNPLVQANYLASPPLVVAYALAGSTDVDLTTEPIGHDANGRPVMLQEIWPTAEEVRQTLEAVVTPELFTSRYSRAFDGNDRWNAIPVTPGELYAWDDQSTYIQHPPFLLDIEAEPQPVPAIAGARVLCLLGDSVTTDHISPAGSIAQDSPAGRYLIEQGVAARDFNSYGARRGNDRVMHRGTFANIRIRNQLAPNTEGGVTRHLPDGRLTSIFEAAEQYRAEDVPLIVLAGKEYGTGSSRDWAAKGTYLLGVKAVIASSFERIHRSNLVGMGVLPLEFTAGQSWQSLGLTGEEQYELPLAEPLQPLSQMEVVAKSADGVVKRFSVRVRIDTPVECDYYRHGGILPYVLRKLLREKAS